MTRKRILPLLIICLLTASLSIGGCFNSKTPAPSGDNPQSPEPEMSSQEAVLYFADQQAEYLIAEKRNIRFIKAESPASAVIDALIAGPQDKNLMVTIPPEAKLLSVKIEDKIAVVDFSEEIRSKHWGGSAGETMTIMSLVNSLTELEGIEKVQILIEGEKQDSLAGHWEINEPLSRNEDIIKK